MNPSDLVRAVEAAESTARSLGLAVETDRCGLDKLLCPGSVMSMAAVLTDPRKRLN